MDAIGAPSDSKAPPGGLFRSSSEGAASLQMNSAPGVGQVGVMPPRVLHPHASAAAAVLAAASQQMATSLNHVMSGGVPQSVPGTTLIAPNPTNSMVGVQHPHPSQQTSIALTPQVLSLLGTGLLPISSLPGSIVAPVQVPSHVSGQPQSQPAGHSVGQAHSGGLTGHPAHSAAAAANFAAAHASAAASSGTIANAMLSSMQLWKLDRLEAHVKLLRDANKSIPQPIALLLAEARRKEEKRAAKRVANRKSAFTSRARKKALVEEMTKVNARLRRQALILSLLPDLVISISVGGEITFCSGQVERVLCHSVEDLIGAQLSDILIPASRASLNQLVKELVAAEEEASKESLKDRTSPPPPGSLSHKGGANDVPSNKDGDENKTASVHSSAAVAAELSSGGAMGSTEQSFPMAVVKVDSQVNPADNSDLSASKPTSDRPRPQSSSDDSLSSSSDARNLHTASEALNRNVRWHNKKMMSKSSASPKASSAHKDDVTGASVTANNADARLSSLQHRADSPIEGKIRKRHRLDELENQSSSSSSNSLLVGVEKKKSRKDNVENASEDSGYRESNESSREDTFSESTSTSQNVGRPTPLAPTCTLCLIRDDLTTIWCEVTSSIRTRDLNEEAIDEKMTGFTAQSDSQSSSGKTSSVKTVSSKEVKELLLCLRPIRDGDETMGESFRFVAKKESHQKQTTLEEPGSSAAMVSSGASAALGVVESAGSSDSPSQHRPPKKRPLQKDASFASRISAGSQSCDASSAPSKKVKTEGKGRADATERSAIESLMLMQSPKRGQPE